MNIVREVFKGDEGFELGMRAGEDLDGQRGRGKSL